MTIVPVRISQGYEEVRVGDALPGFSVPLTLQRMIMEASANRDFTSTHFDPAAADAVGAPAVFAGTTFVETLLEVGIRTWAGLSPRIAVLEFSMLTFTRVGDLVTVGGRVTGKGHHRGQRSAELSLWLDSPSGRTVTASAVVVFPDGFPQPETAQLF